MSERLDMVLVVPAASDTYGVIQTAHVPEFHLGVGYIAGYLRAHGRTVEVVDMSIQQGRLEDVYSHVSALNPRVLGITLVTSLYAVTKDMVKALRPRLPDTFFVCGGPHATARPEGCIEDLGFDAVAVGEGEGTCLALVNAVRDGGDMAGIPGLAYANAEHTVVHTGQAQRMDLDSLPYPARDQATIGLYKNQVYFDNPQAPSYNILTTRGCPYRCTFCGASTVFPGKTRRRSARNVFDEMCFARERYGIRYFFFEDSTFVFLEDLVTELCELIIQARLDITWGAMGRLNLVQPDLYRRMQRAGCQFLFFGVESGDNQILKVIRKNFTIEQAFENLRIVKEIGIVSNCSFILGLPGETRQTLEKTVRAAIAFDPDYVSFSLATPYPGTELWQQCLDDGWTPPPWEDFARSRYQDPVYVPSGLTAPELKHWLQLSYRRFYLRPAYMLRHLAKLRSPAMFRRHASMALSLVGQYFKPKT
jgi:radical SAM superfamily enzyme YgiQ (UPF0313 family)